MSFARFAIVWCWWGEPTKIESAIPAAFSRMTSSISVMIVSLERSSSSTLFAPETRSTIGVSTVLGISARSMPRVSMSVSAWGASGTMLSDMHSRPVVGPRK